MLSFLSKEIVLSFSLNNLPITLYLHNIKSGDSRVATLTADNALVYVQNTISQNTHDSTHPLIIYLYSNHVVFRNFEHMAYYCLTMIPTPHVAVQCDHGPQLDHPGGSTHSTPVSQGSSIMSYPGHIKPPFDGGGLSHTRILIKTIIESNIFHW